MDFLVTVKCENNLRKSAMLTLNGKTYIGKYTYDYPCVNCDLEDVCTDKTNSLCAAIDEVRATTEDSRSVYWISNSYE